MARDECQFDRDGICHALACFASTTRCGARDERGTPKYAATEKCVEEEEVKSEEVRVK